LWLKVVTLEHILKLFLATIFLMILAFAGAAQAPAQLPGVADIYLARDNGSGQAGDRATSFLPTDIPIYCVVRLDAVATVTVRMNLVAENVPGVKPETKVVSTSYTTKNGEDRVNFYGKPSGNWTPGKYRADIFINDAPVKDVTFEIVGPVKVAAASKSFVQRKPTKPAPTARKKTIIPVTAQVVDH